MNKGIVFLIIGMGFSLFLLAGCQKNNIQKDNNTSDVVKQLDTVFPGSGENNTFHQNVQVLIDMLRYDILPTVSGEDKEESLEIIEYFETIKTKNSDYFVNEDILMELGRVIMRTSELLARIDPKDFDTNIRVSSNYVNLATSIGGSHLAPEKVKQFNKEFNEKGVQAARILVKNFPDNPLSYGQLAHSIFYTGGDKQEAIKILNKCIEVDNKSKYCNDLLNDMKSW